MKRSVMSDIDMSSDEDEFEEEPRIQDVLKQLSGAVHNENARNLLHSMAASKDILFWSPNGDLIRHKRRIPNTSIADLLEFVILPHSKDISPPKAIRSFLEGLADLRVNKRWIKNKVALNDVLGFENNKNNNKEESSDNEGTSEDEDSSGGEESNEESSSASEDTQEGGGIEKKVKSSCFHCQGNNVYRSDIAECPVCFWRDAIRGRYNEDKDHICPICQTESRLGNVYKESFQRCDDCHTLQHYNTARNRIKTLLPGQLSNTS